ncbi:trypsin-like peptidase domain-containing protein [Aggregicoccus sp. 17bor-14]|uniref:S1 family peptidase n=1 Tax=Myxococcaceae TaxID=31 RepID=UPI00129C44A4|nr:MULTISPECIES: serine protease [Myxococcaceae]MBF5041340.1 trypsin-like peptidase domain-containing protein [Simulacricoccus sp. 17bor-14]MRI87126.1 trypsin-like peptidase domain-containing protein [Aggregicoccus sp. 17bor-14]
MRLPCLLSLWLLALPAHAQGPAAAPPTRAGLQRALEAHARSAVQVQGPHKSGPGVIVGAGGQVLTSVEQVGLYEAQVQSDAGPQRAPVLMASASLKVALLRLPGEGHPAASVALLPSAGAERPWLIGVVDAQGKRARAVAGRAAPSRGPFLRVPLALAPGSPLFDAQGRLVAVAVARRGPRACEALPLSAVKQQLVGTK